MVSHQTHIDREFVLERVDYTDPEKSNRPLYRYGGKFLSSNSNIETGSI